MNRRDSGEGFTIVELMLAMGFVSALLIAVAMTVIQIGGIYNRGITLKSVNQAGTAIASELQRTISTSSSSSMTFAPNPPGTTGGSVIGGRLCTGNYTYIWNKGSAIQNSPDSIIKYSANPNKTIYFAKAYDPYNKYCTLDGGSYPAIAQTDITELLNNDNASATALQLAIHDFTVDNPVVDSSTGQRLYHVSFVIGTSDISALVAPSYDSCSTSDLESNFNYCSVNRFDIVARAGNSLK